MTLFFWSLYGALRENGSGAVCNKKSIKLGDALLL